MLDLDKRSPSRSYWVIWATTLFMSRRLIVPLRARLVHVVAVHVVHPVSLVARLIRVGAVVLLGAAVGSNSCLLAR